MELSDSWEMCYVKVRDGSSLVFSNQDNVHKVSIKRTTAADVRFRASSSHHLAIVVSTINANGGYLEKIVASPASTKKQKRTDMA